MSEKLCLKWNDFQENINSSFGNLRKDNDLSDVTLACEDGQQIEAHKVILSVSSPLFENLLKRNKHSHPLIFMRGMKSEDLNAIVDFLYYGEANVFQENLDSFLGIAEELQLKGLTGQTSGYEEKESKNPMEATPIPMKPKEVFKRDSSNFEMQPIKRDEQSSTINNETRVAIPNNVSGDLQELDEQVKSMTENSQNMISSGRERAKICKVCGKEGERKSIRDHIEANHLEDIALPCNACGKTFRSRWSLRKHICRNI